MIETVCPVQKTNGLPGRSMSRAAPQGAVSQESRVITAWAVPSPSPCAAPPLLREWADQKSW